MDISLTRIYRFKLSVLPKFQYLFYRFTPEIFEFFHQPKLMIEKNCQNSKACP